MGWTFIHSISLYRSKREYIDRNCCTWDGADTKGEVVKSAMVGSTYYAAVRRTNKGTGQGYVFGVVVLTRSAPRDPDGYTFGYKDMDESMGPCYYDCPAGILDLLDPTEQEYALNWRQKCRDQKVATAEGRRRAPKIGDRIRLAEPLKFTDGASLADFQVVNLPRRGRQRTAYKSLTNGLYYAIPKIGSRQFSRI